MTIPPVLHFCWIGPSLPWAYAFALLSAAARSEMSDVVLHHTDELEDGEVTRVLRAAPGVRLARLDPVPLLCEAADRLDLGDALAALYRRLDDPVQRSDVLRAAILYIHGGIYADLDTVTVASLRPLLGTEAFVGSEFIVWPQEARVARAARSPRRLARPMALDLVRKLFRALPGGWKGFKRVERLYARSVNNAVMGSEAGSTLMAAYLRAMVALPPARQSAPYGLGPHLLLDVVGSVAKTNVTVAAPACFYPLPPEISEHWFRPRRTVDLGQVLAAETRIVHWYASVRTRARVATIDPAYVRGHRERQLYSALVCACIPELASFRPRDAASAPVPPAA